ncbi:MAG TPA: hypothetical protein VFB19_02075 [Mycobacterium sp.]|nr:hypothetical protein [Mycobacterium sp.]
MVIAGIILVVLGLFGIARAVTLPLGGVLIVIGLIWDIIALTGHALTAIF